MSKDRMTYDQAVRLQFGLISKRKSQLADYAINTQAANLAVLRKLGPSFLTPENQAWLEDFISELGRAEFITQLDPLSQASMIISQQDAPEKEQKIIDTPLDNIKYDGE